MTQEEMKDQILALKKEKDMTILAHYYIDGTVQDVADYIGDSFYLSKIATYVKNKNILFAGVMFMGESAKLLNPEKHVYLADAAADCPMAHMVTPEDIAEVREKYDDVAVVCYVNSTAEIKALSDVCVTSANAIEVVRHLTEKHIFFVPDNNLGNYVAGQVPEKEFIFHDGFCHVHTSIEAPLVREAKELHPDAKVLTHPECTRDVLEISDFIGSTAQIIEYAATSQDKEFIICTEMGVFYDLAQKCPNKRFYSVGHRQFCPNMKKVTLERVLSVLQNPGQEVILPDDIMERAKIPLMRMLELAK